jgi:hypothetical protein
MRLMSLFLFLAMASVSQATIVQSGSKYPVYIEVYKGSSTCKPNQGELDSAVNNVEKAYKAQKGKGVLSQLFAGAKEAINNTLQGSGCERVGKAFYLDSEGQNVNLPAGAFIVALKDPVRAMDEKKKVVNPLPALCSVPPGGKKVTLETRKSEGLRSIFGMAGDGGLKCTIK